MMKKFFSLATIAAVVASMTLSACNDSKTKGEESGPSTPEEYAEELVDLLVELQEAETAGDTQKAEQIDKKGEELSKEVEAKCKEDKEFEKEFKAACRRLITEKLEK